IFIVFSLFSFGEMLSFERHLSIVKSFTQLVDIKSHCSSAEKFAGNSTASVISIPCPLANNTVIVKEIPCEREGPWYEQNKMWHYPVQFPRCSMDVCFNYSRCENMKDIRIFTYDRPSPPHSNAFSYGCIVGIMVGFLLLDEYFSEKIGYVANH
ncbi:hypothetical protein KI387_005442, partial [Taxus chinensis]